MHIRENGPPDDRHSRQEDQAKSGSEQGVDADATALLREKTDQIITEVRVRFGTARAGRPSCTSRAPRQGVSTRQNADTQRKRCRLICFVCMGMSVGACNPGQKVETIR